MMLILTSCVACAPVGPFLFPAFVYHFNWYCRQWEVFTYLLTVSINRLKSIISVDCSIPKIIETCKWTKCAFCSSFLKAIKPMGDYLNKFFLANTCWISAKFQENVSVGYHYHGWRNDFEGGWYKFASGASEKFFLTLPPLAYLGGGHNCNYDV